MEIIRERMKKFSGVIYVFAKIGYVASIVGVCICCCSLLWAILSDNSTVIAQIGKVTISSPIQANGMNSAELYATLAYTAAYCAFLIVIMRLAMRLFANIRDNYTPFTMENATLFKREAIWIIIASIVPAIVGQAVGSVCAKAMSLPFSMEFGDGFSLVVVLLFFVMSMAFQYGCALQEQADTTL